MVLKGVFNSESSNQPTGNIQQTILGVYVIFFLGGGGMVVTVLAEMLLQEFISVEWDSCCSHTSGGWLDGFCFISEDSGWNIATEIHFIRRVG